MADYFKKKHLIEFGEGKFGEDAPEYWKNFMNYYGNVMAEGELTRRAYYSRKSSNCFSCSSL